MFLINFVYGIVNPLRGSGCKCRGFSALVGVRDWGRVMNGKQEEKEKGSGPVSCPKAQKQTWLTWPNDWLPFRWDRPEQKIGYFETGDPVEPVTCDPKQLKPGFEFLDQRDDIPEEVKKQFRFGMSRKKEMYNFNRNNRVKMFQRHPFDQWSHEARIADYTAKVRSLQDHLKIKTGDGFVKVVVTKCHQKRHRLLNELYRMDAKRYEVVKRNLDIEHRPSVPGKPDVPRIERKLELRRLTKEYCEDIRKEKLQALHSTLKTQQETFRKEKGETEKWVADQMENLRITEEDLEKFSKV